MVRFFFCWDGELRDQVSTDYVQYSTWEDAQCHIRTNPRGAAGRHRRCMHSRRRNLSHDTTKKSARSTDIAQNFLWLMIPIMTLFIKVPHDHLKLKVIYFNGACRKTDISLHTKVLLATFSCCHFSAMLSVRSAGLRASFTDFTPVSFVPDGVVVVTSKHQ